MNRRAHNLRVKADDKFKQYFKRWEVFKLCQTRIKEYFDRRKNINGRQNSIDSVQAGHDNESHEKDLFERLLLPLLERSKHKFGSLDDLVPQKPAIVFESNEQRSVDESWKKSIKKYKIDGFLCVPSLYKYDPYEPDLLRTSSDTCVKYGNYESHVPPEKRFWGLHKRNPTLPEKEGSGDMIGGGGYRRVQCDKKGSVKPLPSAKIMEKPTSASSSVHDVLKWNDPRLVAQKQVRILKAEPHRQYGLMSSKGDQTHQETSHQAKGSVYTSSSSSIEDSLVRRFTRPIREQLKQQTSGNRPGSLIGALKSATPSNLHGTETKCTKMNASKFQNPAFRISGMNKKRSNTETAELRMVSNSQVNVGKRCTSGCITGNGNLCKTTSPHNIQMLQNAKSYKLHCEFGVHDDQQSSVGVGKCSGGSGQSTTEVHPMKTSAQPKLVKIPENNGKNTTECLPTKDIGNQHVSSMCGEWKPNLAGLVLDASKLSRSIKTSSTNELPFTPNQKRGLQYQCRRKQSENIVKTPLRVMNYCFEGHVTAPARPGAALKSENRKLLSTDKVSCGWDGVKKKDRQYGSNFSVKASKSHFDLTTQVLLQASGFRK